MAEAMNTKAIITERSDRVEINVLEIIYWKWTDTQQVLLNECLTDLEHVKPGETLTVKQVLPLQGGQICSRVWSILGAVYLRELHDCPATIPKSVLTTWAHTRFFVGSSSLSNQPQNHFQTTNDRVCCSEPQWKATALRISVCQS